MSGERVSFKDAIILDDTVHESMIEHILSPLNKVLMETIDLYCVKHNYQKAIQTLEQLIDFNQKNSATSKTHSDQLKKLQKKHDVLQKLTESADKKDNKQIEVKDTKSSQERDFIALFFDSTNREYFRLLNKDSIRFLSDEKLFSKESLGVVDSYFATLQEKIKFSDPCHEIILYAYLGRLKEIESYYKKVVTDPKKIANDNIKLLKVRIEINKKLLRITNNLNLAPLYSEVNLLADLYYQSGDVDNLLEIIQDVVSFVIKNVPSSVCSAELDTLYGLFDERIMERLSSRCGNEALESVFQNDFLPDVNSLSVQLNPLQPKSFMRLYSRLYIDGYNKGGWYLSDTHSIHVVNKCDEIIKLLQSGQVRIEENDLLYTQRNFKNFNKNNSEKIKTARFMLALYSLKSLMHNAYIETLKIKGKTSIDEMEKILFHSRQILLLNSLIGQEAKNSHLDFYENPDRRKTLEQNAEKYSRMLAKMKEQERKQVKTRENEITKSGNQESHMDNRQLSVDYDQITIPKDAIPEIIGEIHLPEINSDMMESIESYCKQKKYKEAVHALKELIEFNRTSNLSSTTHSEFLGKLEKKLADLQKLTGEEPEKKENEQVEIKESKSHKTLNARYYKLLNISSITSLDTYLPKESASAILLNLSK